VVSPVLQGPEHGRQNVNQAKMKHCPGFHKPFASTSTTVALQQFVFWCQETANYPTSAKASRLRRHAHCGVQASQVVQKHFIMVQKSSKGTGLLHMIEKNLFGAFSLRKNAVAKKETTNTIMKQQKKVNSCTQNILESKTDVALTACTCQTKINGTSHISRDR